MKVCLLASSFPRFEGDLPGIFVYQLGQHLRQLGIDVIALVPHEHPLPRQECLGGINVYRFPYFLPHAQQRLCYGAGIPANVQHDKLACFQLPFYCIAQLAALAQLIRRLRIDVVNSHWLIPQGFNAAVIQKWMHTPHVCTIHAAGLFALRRLVGARRMARFVTRHADHIFTVSTYNKGQLDELVTQETNAEVLPMGVQVDQFTKLARPPHKQPNTLLFVGRLVEEKGLWYLIEAMRSVVAELPDTKLLLVGDGPLLQVLGEQVRAAGLEQNIQFLGRKSHIEMPLIYARADLVVLSSISEGMPVVVLEAMASGKPVVASNITGIPDVVQDGVNGFLVEPKSATALAAGIMLALKHPNIGNLQRHAQATAARYDWQIIAARYAEVFYRVTAT